MKIEFWINCWHYFKIFYKSSFVVFNLFVFTLFSIAFIQLIICSILLNRYWQSYSHDSGSPQVFDISDALQHPQSTYRTLEWSIQKLFERPLMEYIRLTTHRIKSQCLEISYWVNIFKLISQHSETRVNLHFIFAGFESPFSKDPNFKDRFLFTHLNQ